MATRRAGRMYALFIEISPEGAPRRRFYRISRFAYRKSAAVVNYQDALLFGSLNGLRMWLRPTDTTDDIHAPGISALRTILDAETTGYDLGRSNCVTE